MKTLPKLKPVELKKVKVFLVGLFRRMKKPEFYTLAKRFYIFLLLVVTFFTLYHIGYSKKIIPGVRVGNTFVGGMSYDDAVKAIQSAEKKLDKTITLTYQGKQFEMTEEGIELEYDVEATVTRVFELGRSGNIFIDTKDKLASLIKTIRMPMYYTVDDGALSNQFALIRGEINIEPKSATFVLDNGFLTLEDSMPGRRVEDKKMYDTVISSISNLDYKSKTLLVETIEPELTKAQLEKVYSQVELIVFDPLTVNYEEKEWVLTPQQLLDFVEVKSDNWKVTAGLDKVRFESYVETLSQSINQLPRGKVTSNENGRVTGFELTKKGIELNIATFTEDFKDAFINGTDTVTVSVTKISSLDDYAKYGIFTLLGEGVSKYTGSANERIHNLTLAAERTNGVIVPPGEIYSFNNSVGEISGVTGYDTGYIIANGRTVLGEGGGVCQTSTTLFRAVLDAGLPVVIRHPHAYRVYYYELDQPVGFDASVYQPSLDFQFRNDTPNHVLVQTSWDLSTSSLTFKIYGTPDGRSVEITEPVVTGLVKPPEPLYQDDPTLPKGVTKQVDWSAWGANSYFTRTVTRDESVIYEDTFSSTYQPWKAIFLVGTKEN
jgi:vancomycin resistance protein YoaR